VIDVRPFADDFPSVNDFCRIATMASADFCPITTRSCLCWRYWLPSGLLDQGDEPCSPSLL
ncbi:hypothetical protein, partial [Endozoicomonas sp. ALC013]|uniref:hypothetical protein n=1 Tax=Endozoicomonas sp. ALC013 TaxID=3403076 RepID=UPI003BB5F362